MFIVNFFKNTTWLVNMISFIAGCGFIITVFFAILKKIKFRLQFKLDKNNKDICALSIGFGKNDPKKAVIDFLGNEFKGSLVSKHYTNKVDKEANLTFEEVQNALKDIQNVIGELRRNNCKEVLVFCAVSMAAALKIGYMFKSYHGNVKFMQPCQGKGYEVMAIPE